MEDTPFISSQASFFAATDFAGQARPRSNRKDTHAPSEVRLGLLGRIRVASPDESYWTMSDTESYATARGSLERRFLL
ncbi:hypothetical protein JTE90_027432 [Oedothorax gibbosus]|uniref:Uncharacterized protein n=1 Tax=Oedothorax gibbosus TaxID=931172 RepID=A0AAV6VY75_9ARAC|nr:hypothetical protein JTE90_027432 [Oedothorax gibbosus]